MAKQRKDVRELTVSEACGYNYSRVPGIRIQGKWLAELGFEPGDILMFWCKMLTILPYRAEIPVITGTYIAVNSRQRKVALYIISIGLGIRIISTAGQGR